MTIDREKQSLLQALNRKIADDEAIGLDDLRAMAQGIAPYVAPSLGQSAINDVIDEISELRQVQLSLGAAVIDKANFTPWIEERKQSEALRRWNAYKELLFERNWAPRVIENLDVQTDRVVELMGDPTVAGEWKRRGLAIGEVQSGKTATYIGVLNKAIDYGYKIIVVIGGHTEDLRRQTQGRIDTDLTGRDSAFMEDHIDADVLRNFVGVGAIDPGSGMNILTTVNSDFSAAAKRAGRVAVDGATPTVFVVKKHAGLLRNLASYLSRQSPIGRLSAPMVVIDDEADWASINTRDEDNVAAVNGSIRELLAASGRNSYLAITATPFANVLIDDANEDDLFPRHYIQALESPSNYEGIARYFGDSDTAGSNTGALISDVDDCLAIIPFTHKSSHRIAALPESLLDAVATFVVASAIRRYRDGKSRASSMMVNISRFIAVQERIHGLVVQAAEEMRASITAEFAMPDGAELSPTAERLRRAWAQHYRAVDVPWQAVRGSLLEVADSLRVELVNGKTSKARGRRRSEMSLAARAAEDLQPTIFVGGNVLARGLTLDGLTVSYFPRRAGAADTLLQMGRWFGYRPGYEDLVRIWIDSSVVDLFRYVAEISSDLRSSMRQMNALNLTPVEFGVKIRRHPEAFQVTAAAKQRAGEDYSGEVLVHGQKFESFLLSSEQNDLDRNRQAAIELLRGLLGTGIQADNQDRKSRSAHTVWRGVPRSLVEGFFRSFRGHDGDVYFGRATPNDAMPQIAKYLAEAVRGDTWDVALVHGSRNDWSVAEGITQSRSLRRNLEKDGPLLRFANRRVAAGSDVKSMLTPSELEALRSRFEGERLTETRIVQRGFERPALLIYAIESDAMPESKTQPIVAALIAFPGLSEEEEAAALREHRGAKFIVNRVYARINLGFDDALDDETDASEEGAS